MMFWLTITVGISVVFWIFFVRKSRYWKLVDQIPGPPGIPVFGNALDLPGDHAELLKKLVKWHDEYKVHKIYKMRIGSSVYVYFSKASCIETILNNSELIEKSWIYDLMTPWVGSGLVTSTGLKWKNRRKLLTPAFHFKILDNFAAIFNEHSKIFVKQLAGKAENQTVNLFPLMARLTLDVICETHKCIFTHNCTLILETAMGCHLNAQTDEDSDYVKALTKTAEIVMTRMFTPWLQTEWMFKLFPMSAEHDRCLKTLHSFTKKVIQERKNEWKKYKSEDVDNREDTLLGKRKRLAFLDLLLEASQNGQGLSDDDIQEEVDTFMFAGHDTTSAAMSACLYLLGHNPEHQLKVQEEIDAVLSDDENQYITPEDVTNLKYLECVIKESMRLLPAVPMFSRKLTKDLTIENCQIPAGVTIIIAPVLVHRDAEAFPEPEKFDPDRFTLNGTVSRNPYAYIPFSAGPRNCIGQRFAMLEMKIVLAHVLKKFSVKSTQSVVDLRLASDIILRPMNGYKVIMTLRH